MSEDKTPYVVTPVQRLAQDIQVEVTPLFSVRMVLDVPGERYRVTIRDFEAIELADRLWRAAELAADRRAAWQGQNRQHRRVTKVMEPSSPTPKPATCPARTGKGVSRG